MGAEGWEQTRGPAWVAGLLFPRKYSSDTNESNQINRMTTRRQFLRLNTTLASLMAATFFTAAVHRVEAGEVPILNHNFDNLAPSPAWYWENWSLAGSTNWYDATLNGGGGAAGSGSLRLVAPYAAVAGWQQAIFTLVIADVDASGYDSLSFDV
jgi:hypothetical protein